jgi:hypothetical protein
MAVVTGEVKHAIINATSDGDNAVVAAVAGKQILVIGFFVSATAAGLILLQDTAASPVVHARLSLGINGSASYAGGLHAPAFKTAAGTGLEVSNPASVDVHGFVTYIEV